MTEIDRRAADEPLKATFAVKSAILVATGLALLASPLVSAGMSDIARDFAGAAETDPVAIAIASVIEFFSGDVDIRFLIKFILLSIPALFIAIGSPIMGWITDRWGRRKLLILSTILFGVAGVSGALVSSLAAIFVGRALLGLASAGMKTTAFAMTGDFFEGKARAQFVGLQGSAMKIGGFVFLYFGGLLAAVHWKVGFLGYALAFVFLPLMFMIPESLPKKAPLAKDAPKPPKESVPLLPAIDVVFVAFAAAALFFLTIVQAPFFLPEKFGSTPAGVGLATGTANLAAAISAVTFHHFKMRLTYPGIFGVIFLLMSVGYAIVAMAPSFELVVFGLVIAGCGFGLIVPAQSAWVLAVVPPSRRGTGIGIVTTSMYMGQFFIPILIIPFVDPSDPSHIFKVAAIALGILAGANFLRELVSRNTNGTLALLASGLWGAPQSAIGSDTQRP